MTSARIAGRPRSRHVSMPSLLTCLLLLATAGACLGCGGEAPIKTEAIGWWQETGTDEAYTLHVVPTGSGRYEIEYARAFVVPFDAVREGDRIVVHDMSQDMLTLTYDADSDCLRAASPYFDPVVLRRTSAP